MMKFIFPYKLLLTDTQISKICKAFANGLSANIKFSKTQLSKIQSGGFIFSLPSDIICNKKIILLVRSIAKKVKEYGCIFVDARLNFTGKRIKKRNFINYWFRNNSNKQWNKRLLK